MITNKSCALAILAACLIGRAVQACPQLPESSPPQTETSRANETARQAKVPVQELRKVVRASFEQVHDGWSSDEVILNSDLNREFLKRCKAALAEVEDVEFNWTLINMRKAGLLDVTATKRSPRSEGQWSALAEIAARHVYDLHRVSTDRMMCDPSLREEFDRVVQSIDDQADLIAVRRAAFQLRKQRQLRPELLVRIADWGREIHSYPLGEARSNPALIPQLPGIYIFRDHTGYLYIGQADNLNTRLQTHFGESHNFSLARYLKDQSNDKITLELHSFPADSRAKETMIRRAYESELISSRKPRFNIQP